MVTPKTLEDQIEGLFYIKWNTINISNVKNKAKD